MAERYGEYELIQQIATGGMAEIHLARQRGFAGLDRLVIIKRMLPQLAVRPEFVTMFLDEARLTANLQHPNIARVHDLGEVDGSYFISMELVDGPHLGALFAHSLRARQPLPIDLCVWVCARAAEGLHYAHEMNDPATGLPLELVHRDISPQNILVSKDGDAKVTDFGVAKASNQQTKTRTGIIKGKVAYMSPEQCLGDKLDRRTDIFALGIVLYELLTRRRLFRDKSDLLIMQKITGEDVPPPSTVNANLDPTLDAIVRKSLSRDVAKRFQTAEDFASALDTWLAGRVDGHAMARWFDAHCPELAPSTTIDVTTKSALVEPEKTAATPSMGSAETLGLTADLARRGAASEQTERNRAAATTMESAPAAPTSMTQRLQAPVEADVALGLDETTPVPRKSRAPLLAAASVAVVGVLAIVGFVATRPTAETANPTNPTNPTTNPTNPTNPMTNPGQAMGKLHVETVPSGVSIIVGDRIVGKSPVDVDVPAGVAAEVQAQFADQPPRKVSATVGAGALENVVVPAWVPMTVKSTPSKAKVKIDGVARGETPWAQGYLVEPGQPVKLRVEAPGMQAYEETVVGKPGEPLDVEVKLTALERVAVVDKTVVAGFGTLSVNSEPWVNVRFDDKKLETPFTGEKIKAGKQSLTISNPKFGINETIVVTVPKDKGVVVILGFEKQGSAFKLVRKSVR